MADDFFDRLRPLKDDELIRVANKALRRFNEDEYVDCGREIRTAADIILILAELKWKVPKARAPNNTFAKRLQASRARIPQDVWDAFFEIRETGNEASHPGANLTRDEAANALQLLTRLGKWALEGFAENEQKPSPKIAPRVEPSSKKSDAPRTVITLPSDVHRFFHFRNPPEVIGPLSPQTENVELSGSETSAPELVASRHKQDSPSTSTGFRLRHLFIFSLLVFGPGAAYFYFSQTPRPQQFPREEVAALLDRRNTTPKIDISRQPNPPESPPSEMERFRRWMYIHWNPPFHSPGAIGVRIYIGRDRKLSAPPMILTAGTGTVFNAGQEAVVRAITKAQPFNMLLPDNYEKWKQMDLIFTPPK